MIVEFSVKNFRSIKDLQTISFVATGLISSEENSDVDRNNIRTEGEHRLLKTIGIYGANASGKSNVLLAFKYFSKAISEPPSPESNLSSLFDPFLFQDNPENSEVFFQVVFYLNGNKYRYGFTILQEQNDVYFDAVIASEWLYGPGEKNQVCYFSRKKGKSSFLNLDELINLPDLQHGFRLFLTHAASFVKGKCYSIREKLGFYITKNIGFSTDYHRSHSINFLKPGSVHKENLMRFFNLFDLKYKDIYIEKQNNILNDKTITLDDIYCLKPNSSNPFKDVRLNMQRNESDGTKKLFDLAGQLIYAFNFHTSGLLILDELDSNFHPSLVIKLIELFNDPKINESGVQLLFTSHDTNIMSPSIMRRDQFYFTEKDQQDATKIYSLADLKGIRNNADFARQYLAGFYGAIPGIGNLSDLKNKQE